jgi:hypothetical protein
MPPQAFLRATGAFKLNPGAGTPGRLKLNPRGSYVRLPQPNFLRRASSLAFPGEALAHNTAQIDDISDATVLNDYRPATGAGGRASNAARKLLDAGHLEHIETNKETDPAYKKGSRPKTYITTS